ncbi:uncharacterized protein [Chanodichthys erythropterus]|uniref:uncharacterized protein n=1 Tax=Chanodichthys erythropterus TaxID=933992 RepID=UPI00351F31B6
MKFPLTVCVFLLTVISSLSVDITVRGMEGEPVIIKCPYAKGYEDSYKYFYKGVHRDSVMILQSNGGKSKDRFSLLDDCKNRSFTVTISDLKMEDAGLYGCSAGAEHYKEVNLIVLRAPQRSRPLQISTSSIRPYINTSIEHTNTEHSSTEHTEHSSTEHTEHTEHTGTEHSSSEHSSSEHSSPEHSSSEHSSSEHSSPEHSSTEHSSPEHSSSEHSSSEHSSPEHSSSEHSSSEHSSPEHSSSEHSSSEHSSPEHSSSEHSSSEHSSTEHSSSEHSSSEHSSSEHSSSEHSSSEHSSSEHSSSEHSSPEHSSSEHSSTEHSSSEHSSSEHSSTEHSSTVTHQEAETTRTKTGNTTVELYQPNNTMRTDLVYVAGGVALVLLVLCLGTLLILKMRKRKCGTALFLQNVQHNTETDHVYEEIPNSDGAVATSSSSQTPASHLNTHPKVSAVYVTITNQPPDSNLSHTHSSNQVTDCSPDPTEDSRTEQIYVTATHPQNISTNEGPIYSVINDE